MGRYSQQQPTYSYDKFTRMKEFYDKFGKNWKVAVTFETCLQVIELFKEFALKDNNGKIADKLVEEKIQKVQAFYDWIRLQRDEAFTIMCTTCNGRLYQESVYLINLEQYNGVTCPTKRQCRMEQKR